MIRRPARGPWSDALAYGLCTERSQHRGLWNTDEAANSAAPQWGLIAAEPPSDAAVADIQDNPVPAHAAGMESRRPPLRVLAVLKLRLSSRL